MGFPQWFDGIYLIGQFNWFRTGCWLLVYRGAAAILEMPPAGLTGPNPVDLARLAVEELSVASVKYLLCTHSHIDHFSTTTHHKLREAFPRAETCLQLSFRSSLIREGRSVFFDAMLKLVLDQLGGQYGRHFANQ